MFHNFAKEWFSNIPKDLLSGSVVALALIPEAIAFSIIAGVDPTVGLYASFIIALLTAFFGGRPGMISAATGAMALLIVLLVREHGLQYLLATTVLTGVLQVLAGIFKLGNALRFVSRSVIVGFINALAILIFMAQLTELRGVTWETYAMVAAGLGILYLFPLLTKSIPSPLICVLLLTAVSMITGMNLRTVGDMGELPSTLPMFLFPNVPLNLETLFIILPYAIPLCIVGLLESLMTATLIDDITDTSSDKNRECRGQGIANIVTGFFGGMAGCAVIGQSMINVKSGGRGRLSTFAAGAFLLLMIMVLGDYVARIPMAALVAVMIMVSVGTFEWSSLWNIRTLPKTSTTVMLVTVAVVLYTHNLAWGVGVGVLLSSLFFAHKVARFMRVTSTIDQENEHRTYQVGGQLFFVSANAFTESFNFREVLQKVTIDVTHAHFWDLSAIGALDKVVLKFRRNGAEVEVVGLNEASATLVGRLAVHDKPENLDLSTRN